MCRLRNQMGKFDIGTGFNEAVTFLDFTSDMLSNCSNYQVRGKLSSKMNEFCRTTVSPLSFKLRNWSRHLKGILDRLTENGKCWLELLWILFGRFLQWGEVTSLV